MSFNLLIYVFKNWSGRSTWPYRLVPVGRFDGIMFYLACLRVVLLIIGLLLPWLSPHFRLNTFAILIKQKLVKYNNLWCAPNGYSSELNFFLLQTYITRMKLLKDQIFPIVECKNRKSYIETFFNSQTRKFFTGWPQNLFVFITSVPFNLSCNSNSSWFKDNSVAFWAKMIDITTQLLLTRYM